MKWIIGSAALVLFLTTLEARPQAAASKCKTGPMDLVFIIDSSRSVRPFEFETMRKFMIDIITSLDVGPNATRVGVVQYSSQVKNEFSLKSFFKRSEMEKAINDIVPLAQGTMTGLAIQYAMNFAFTVQEGARPLPKKIPRVALIVTDGRPQDRVTEVAAQARDAGIEIYAVGVQRADMNSLRAMASPPLDEHVFLVESFDLIQQFALQFQDKLCGVDMCTEMDHGCAHNCVSVPGSYYCDCNPGFKLAEDGKSCARIDMCSEMDHGCDHTCVSMPGSYYCECNPGFRLAEDGKSCARKDMCTEMDHGCAHTCVSVPGSYYCQCNPGYKLGEDGKSCIPIDHCAGGQHGCEHLCVSTRGSYQCRCRAGYYLNQDKKTCTMIDYCSFGNHSCEHACVSVLNGYFCRCNEGYTLKDDGKTCQADDMCNVVDHRCEFQCVSTPGSYHCICPEGRQLQADGKTCDAQQSGCATSHVDLVFVIDGSKSVRPQNFELVKQWVAKIVESLNISPQGTRVGLVQYSSRVRTEFDLNQYSSAKDIKNAVLNIDYMEKGTMTGLALQHMVEQSFSEAAGARPLSKNIPRIGLVFTDGRSQDSISEWAKKAKDAGIVMYAVGVGKAVEDELKEIASEPVHKHFYYTSDFSAINQMAEDLKFNVCPEEIKGAVEVKNPCECENIIEFQTSTMTLLQNLTEKLAQMTARLEDLENQLVSKK